MMFRNIASSFLFTLQTALPAVFPSISILRLQTREFLLFGGRILLLAKGWQLLLLVDAAGPVQDNAG